MITVTDYMFEMRQLERAMHEALHNSDQFALAVLRTRAATLNRHFWGREPGQR
jgi:hypothetical protein